MTIKTNHEYILYSICLISFSILLLSGIASAENEINTTLDDNIVILLDYSSSGGSSGCYFDIGSDDCTRKSIQSNAIYFVRNIENDTNVSVVVYGGFVNSSNVYSMDSQDNRSMLEKFIYNDTQHRSLFLRDNIYEGFDEAKKILDNSTGTKQILLFSNGKIHGSVNGKGEMNDDGLIKLVKEIKKNVTINLYQVSTSTLKGKSVMEIYKNFGDKLNSEVVILSTDEKIKFLKPPTSSASPEMTNNSSSEFYNNTFEGDEYQDEYQNEFNNSGETSSVISVIYYGQKDSYLYKVNFYSYCDQTCIIVPFDIEERKFYDDIETLEDVFRSKNAVELVKSGDITESAYVLPNRFSDIICGFFDSDSLNEQAKNLLGEKLPSIEPKTKIPMKILKWGRYISDVDYPVLIVSGECKISNGDELLIKIINGGRYTYNLKNGYAYNGITRDFQIYNKGIMDDIEYRKTAYFGVLNVVYMFNVGVVDNAEPMIKNNNVKLTQLLNQDYKEEAESAFNRINYKSEDSQIFINNATSELNDLNSQIPYTFTEAVLNFIKEPETNYTMARDFRVGAESFLKTATENHDVYKFIVKFSNTRKLEP